MMKTLLVRGMLAGLIAGVLATVFAYFLGEPSVETAIGLEEASSSAEHAHAHGDPAAGAEADGGHSHGEAGAEAESGEEEELVSRDVQSTLGLFAGVGAYGVAIGGLFAIVFAIVHGRLGALRPRLTAAMLGAAGFVVVVLVPFLKYPANPPAVGQPGTIGDRTGLYFGFLAFSLAVAIFAALAGRALSGRFGGWTGGLLAAGGYVVVIGVVAAFLPAIDEVPDGFPGSTLWSFRIAALGTQLVLWAALGLAFGAFAERALDRGRAPQATRQAV